MKTPLLLVFIAINLAACWFFQTSSVNTKVYVRNLMFSDIRSDSDLKDEDALNASVMSGFTHNSQEPERYKSYVNARTLTALQAKKAQGVPLKELVLAIGNMIGPPPTGAHCGISSTEYIVQAVELGRGCCSDYVKAFLVYARRLGIAAREVYVMSHATVEYYAADQKRWIWFDPYFSNQFEDANGQPLSLYNIRAASRTTQLRLLDYPPANASIPAYRDFIGYDVSQYSTILYRKGNNFFDIEALSRQFAWIHPPKAVFQLYTLLTGKHPGFVILTTEALAVYLGALKAVLWAGAWLLCLMNLALAGLLFTAWRQRRLYSHRHLRVRP